MEYEKECLCAFSSREITPCVIYKVTTNRTLSSTIHYYIRCLRKRMKRILSK